MHFLINSVFTYTDGFFLSSLKNKLFFWGGRREKLLWHLTIFWCKGNIYNIKYLNIIFTRLASVSPNL